MTDEADLLRALAANPADDLLRLVYADWLDENPGDGRAEKAEFLWLEAERATAPEDRTKAIERRSFRLAQGLPGDWLATASKRPLEHCDGPRFSYTCPLQWEALTPTGSPAIRYCGSCAQRVYFCGTVKEAREYAGVGYCVAVSAGQVRHPGELRPPEERFTLGIMVPFEPPPDLPDDAPPKSCRDRDQ
jgi:uncharacterized protein (TIGR02996 family)